MLITLYDPQRAGASNGGSHVSGLPGHNSSKTRSKIGVQSGVQTLALIVFQVGCFPHSEKSLCIQPSVRDLVKNDPAPQTGAARWARERVSGRYCLGDVFVFGRLL
ncbi:hypothetical protein sr17488 [Sporisorium reilianum SRZ2]|uniref:Uncharacterized protein n=1 Tax=Sporisorium reilianum (strain SRZ2) TaxID=999809 RepID=E6ZPF8_SPORE|nr:hypothetical protein sr17488 [Sporisorium reilianum SRZ2]